MQLYPSFISLIFVVVFFFSKLYIQGESERCEWPISTSKSGAIRGNASYGRSCSPRNVRNRELTTINGSPCPTPHNTAPKLYIYI